MSELHHSVVWLQTTRLYQDQNKGRGAGKNKQKNKNMMSHVTGSYDFQLYMSEDQLYFGSLVGILQRPTSAINTAWFKHLKMINSWICEKFR